MPSDTEMAPSTLHNSRLCAEVIRLNNVASRYPKASQQINTVPLDTDGLISFGYNPTIAEHEGKIWMVYRFHRGSSSTKLALVEITDSGRVLNNKILELPGKSQEDPRLFVYQNKLCLSWVESRFPEELKAVVKWRVLPDGEINHPALGKNDWSGCEKNWVMFEADGKLWCLYDSTTLYPFHAEPAIKTNLRWPYGEPRGGCIIPWGDKLLRFFHSSLRNEWSGHHTRYFVGACVMDAKPPFAVSAISNRPLLFGSEIDDIKVRHRPMLHWKHNVVFPGGAVARNSHWLLSVGVNDSACVIAKVTEKDLML